MKFREEIRDLFTVDESYYLAHCVSCDMRCGAGIAVEFARRFPEILSLQKNWEEHTHPSVYFIGRVFNLMTKRRYWERPTYESMELCLIALRNMCVSHGVKQLAIPQLGCGLDRLAWGTVKKLIFKHFQDTDIEILVCKLGRKKK